MKVYLGMHGSKTLMNWTERNDDDPEAEREGLKSLKYILKICTTLKYTKIKIVSNQLKAIYYY